MNKRCKKYQQKRNKKYISKSNNEKMQKENKKMKTIYTHCRLRTKRRRWRRITKSIKYKNEA